MRADTPPTIRRVKIVGPSPLSGHYFALTKWRDHGDGQIEAVEKHDVTEDVLAIVDRLADERVAELLAQVESVYSIQCPTRPAGDYMDRGAWVAHQWWQKVLGRVIRDARAALNGGHP